MRPVEQKARSLSTQIWGRSGLESSRWPRGALKALDSRPSPFNYSAVFRPCIDLHEGKVKQLVGSTLGGDPAQLRTNFVSARSSGWYAELYRRDELKGGHVISLGPSNCGSLRTSGCHRKHSGASPGLARNSWFTRSMLRGCVREWIWN